MHKTRPDGSLIESTCDFCGRVWDPEGAEMMIEGHQGSLLCLRCLSLAYTEVVLNEGGREHQGKRCTMCLEDRAQPEWESPVNPECRVCLRCLKQSATALEKDADSGWQRPKADAQGA